MKKVLFASDTHLHPTIWDDLPEVWGDAYRAFDQICLRAVEDDEVTTLLLGGDVFDRQPRSCAMACFNRNMDRLREAGVPVYAIQGQHGRVYNHERDEVVPWPNVHDHVSNLNEQEVKLFPKFNLLGLDYRGPEELEKRIKKIPKRVTAVMLHQMIRGGVPMIEDVHNWDFDAEWFPKHVKLVLAGDLHLPVEFDVPGGKLIYNGATVLRSISEPADKSYTLVGEDMSIERVPIESRVFKQAKIFADQDLGKTVEAASEMEPDGVLYVRYDPRIEEVEEKLRAVGEGIHFYFKPSPVVDTVVGRGEVTLPDNVSPEGVLGEFVDRDKKPALHELVLSLLQAENEKAALEYQRRKALETEIE